MNFELYDGALQIFNVDHGQCALLTMRGSTRVHRVLIDCGHSVDFQGGRGIRAPTWPAWV